MMNEELVSKQKALEDVRILAERLAFLHYAYAKTLERELPTDTAKQIMSEVIEEYGRLIASSVGEKLDEQGLEHILANFKYGNDLPSLGWEYNQEKMPADKPFGKISKITYCPLAETWKKLGDDGMRLGRLYCFIDQTKYKAYGKGYKCFHDKNVLDGDSYCTIRVELDGPQDE